MILTEDLTKHFDDFVAVEGVNLNVNAGEVLILLGPNGAGKTTTVRMLTSILLPTRGRAFVAGYDVVKQPRLVRASVGVLTEHHGLYGRMNALEYLDFYAKLYSIPPLVARKKIVALAENFGLADVLKKRLGEYSKGMRQKLALVRALMHDPPVLLLDEPTSAMDPESSRMVRDAISGLRSSDRTIILCTHNLAEAEELADKVAIIRHGRIILNDTLENIKLNLLGPPEYIVSLRQNVNGWTGYLPKGVEVSARGENWLQFRINNPFSTNPILLRSLVEQHLDIISFQEVNRSLERAYLQAVNLLEENQHA